MGKMEKDHMTQLKQKDDFIRDNSRKHGRPSDGVGGGEGAKPAGRVVTRASLRPPKEPSVGDLKSPGHIFVSPTPTAKKRTFWDITTANIPSVATLSSRKTRSHVSKEQLAAPSMLLQGRRSREFYIARNSSLGLMNIMAMQLASPCLWFVFMLGPHHHSARFRSSQANWTMKEAGRGSDQILDHLYLSLKKISTLLD